MERLCDLRAERLVILCSPCERRGFYQVNRLRQRFGDHASVLDVYLALTQTCRSQREVECRATLDTSGGTTTKSLPSKT